MTETITTRAVVPSTIPTRVSVERSLWLQISAAEVRAASPICTLLVPQGLDGVEAGGPDRRVEAEEDADRHREHEAEDHVLGGHDHRLLDEAAHRVGEADPEAEAEEAARDRHHDALDEELGEDVEARGAEGLAGADLADPLVEGREEDVHD